MIFAVLLMEGEIPRTLGYVTAYSRPKAWKCVRCNGRYVQYGLDHIGLCKVDKKGAKNATSKTSSQQEDKSSSEKTKENNSSSSESLKQTYLQLGPSSV